MPTFSYTARDKTGKLIVGQKNARSEMELVDRLRALGQYLVSSKLISKEGEGVAKKKITVVSQKPKIPPRDVLQFTSDFSVLLNAGIPVLNALTSLKEDIAKPSVKIVVGDLANRISEGASLRDACSEHPRSFSRIYCALVEVGESTGKLDEILVALADLLEWEEDIKRKMIEASTYPIILLTVMLGVVSLLVIKVIPTFEPIFYTLGVELPLPTRIILFVSKYARILWMPVFLGAILAVIGIKFYGSSEKGRYNLDHIKLKLPIFGDLVEKSSFSRFSHVFSLCMNSGVSVLESLELSAEATGNTYITKGVATASDFVSKGEKIADSFKTLGMFPLLVVRMINVGEQTGKLGETMKKVAEFYDKIVPATIRKMFAIFEPAMIVFMGVIVGGIALSLFLPLFQLAGQLGQ